MHKLYWLYILCQTANIKIHNVMSKGSCFHSVSFGIQNKSQVATKQNKCGNSRTY